MGLLKKLLSVLQPTQGKEPVGSTKASAQPELLYSSPQENATVLLNKPSREPQARKGLTQFERFKLRMAKAKVEERNERTKLRVKRDAQRRALRAKRFRVLTSHVESLRLKRFQCLNTWGRLEKSEWLRVKEQFIKSVLRAADSDVSHWMKEIDRLIAKSSAKRVKTPTVEHGTQFEVQVALKLQRLGWSVQLLGKSGDQGGDLLAHKGEKSVVIQCKHYASKVGNAAVQEVMAAQKFYHATEAAVIASAGFTRQAQTLADKGEVLLLARTVFGLVR